MSTIASSLRPGGSLVISVKHPIYSAPTTQRFERSEAGHRVWPLENYLVEGERVTNWFVEGIVKQHRTVATWPAGNERVTRGTRQSSGSSELGIRPHVRGVR